MCGGVGFGYKRIPYSELKKFFSEEQIEKFKKNDKITTFFWDKQPVLPVKENNKISLFDWGNRDNDIRLPKTGWAKQESLEEGKWNYLHPEQIIIPAENGYEKGKWFEIKKGIRGIRIELDNQKRIYMITKSASEKYLKLTGHNREPMLVN